MDINFNHESDSIFESFGIEQTRGELLLLAANENYNRDTQANPHITLSNIVENALMLADTINEQVFVAYLCGQFIQRTKCYADQYKCMQLELNRLLAPSNN